MRYYAIKINADLIFNQVERAVQRVNLLLLGLSDNQSLATKYARVK